MKRVIIHSITTLIVSTFFITSKKATLESDLHKMIDQQDRTALRTFLSEHPDANLNCPSWNKQTPLLKAVLANDLPSVLMLILAGAHTLPTLENYTPLPLAQENDEDLLMRITISAAFLNTTITPLPSFWKLCGLDYKQATLIIRTLLLLDNPNKKNALVEAKNLIAHLTKTKPNEDANLNIISSQAADELTLLTRKIYYKEPQLLDAVITMAESCVKKLESSDQNTLLANPQEDSIDSDTCALILDLISRYSEKQDTLLSGSTKNLYNRLLEKLRRFIENQHNHTPIA